MSAPQGPVLLIGMEVHVQLATQTRCFSSGPVVFGADPNGQMDPVALGVPGALPVLNQEAVRLALRLALALGCTIQHRSVFERKSYFYPDLPKGYQISQYERPLGEKGLIEIDADGGGVRTIRIRRAHLEEDTGKLLHDETGSKSRVDLNRAGTPLLEIVSEPDLSSADEAVRYLEALREIAIYTGASDANMEEGNLRCEPNVNLVLPHGERTPIVEIKNLNSLQAVREAIAYEEERQWAAFRQGGAAARDTARSTRGWDATQRITVHQRSKESADDYRYFPDPDLPPLILDDALIEAQRSALPELPRAKRGRYVAELGLTPYEAGVLTADPALAAYFEAALDGRRSPSLVAAWVGTELLRHVNEQGVGIEEVQLAPGGLGELIDLLEGGRINRKTAQTLFREAARSGASPGEIVKMRGLEKVQDPAAIRQAARQAIQTEEKAFQDWVAGNERARSRLFGAVMKALGNRADPEVVGEVLTALRREAAASS